MSESTPAEPSEPVAAATATQSGEPRRFAFRLPTPTRIFLVLWGVGIRPAEVTLDDRELVVRFGWFGARIAVADIERFEIGGPYVWIRAIAVRNTLFSTDFSFCSDARGAVRLFLRTPRRMGWVRRVDQVYLGVEDLEGLAEGLRARGISGRDGRTTGRSAS
jgi:hypothetical protein